MSSEQLVCTVHSNSTRCRLVRVGDDCSLSRSALSSAASIGVQWWMAAGMSASRLSHVTAQPMSPQPPPTPLSYSLAATAVCERGDGDGWFTEAATNSAHWSTWRETSEVGAEWTVAQLNAKSEQAGADAEWERQWGGLHSSEWEWEWEWQPAQDEGRHTRRQRDDELTLPSSQARNLRRLADLAAPIEPTDFRLAAPHTDTSRRLLSATHSHLFLTPPPAASPLSASSSLLLHSPYVARCCVLVLQCIPSTLFTLSSDTADFTLHSAGAHSMLLSSNRQLLADFAAVGSLLHSIEQVAVSLSTQSGDSVGVSFGGALRSFCSHHKQQVDSVARQGGASATGCSACTVIQLHVAVQPLVQQVRWVHGLLLSSTLTASSTSVSPSSPPIPVGVDLLSHLYHSAQSLSTSSPFHATLTFLFSSALIPYLRLLSSHVSRPPLQPAVHTASGRPALPLPLPSFLLSEVEHVNSAAEMLQVTDRSGGSEWTVTDAACQLAVGWKVEEAQRLHNEMRERSQSQQAQLTAAVERCEAEVREAVQRTSSRRRAAQQANREQLRQQTVEEGAAEETAESWRRAKQDEYRVQLKRQLEEKRRRHDDEREQERAERQAAESGEQRRRTIIDAEREKLITRIRAVRQDRSEGDMRREQWHSNRRLRVEAVRAVWEEDRRQVEEGMRKHRPPPPQSAAQPHASGTTERQSEDGQHESVADGVLGGLETVYSAEAPTTAGSGQQPVADDVMYEQSQLNSTSSRVHSVSQLLPPGHNRSSSDPAFASHASFSTFPSHARSFSSAVHSVTPVNSTPSSIGLLSSSPAHQLGDGDGVRLPALSLSTPPLRGHPAAPEDRSIGSAPAVVATEEESAASVKTLRDPLDESSEGRKQARQRNVTSRVFEQQPPPQHQSQHEQCNHGYEQAASCERRSESAALVSNRQRMTGSRVFESEAENQTAGPPPLPSPTMTEQRVQSSETQCHVPISPAASSPAAAALVLPTDSTNSPTTIQQHSTPSAAHDHSPMKANSVAPLTQPLPVDIAIRSTLVPCLQQQCAFVQQASLNFFLHSLRMRHHFLTLQHFFLFRAGPTMDAFTSALFHSARRDSVSSGDRTATTVSLSAQSVQLLWSDALRSCPPSIDPSRILLLFDSTSPPASAAFSRIEMLAVVDSVRLHYTAPPVVSYLLHPNALAGYSRTFTLLMRLTWAMHDIRAVYQWLRGQEALLRRAEVQQAKRARAVSTVRSFSTTRRRVSAAVSRDDSLLHSPTRHRRPPLHVSSTTTISTTPARGPLVSSSSATVLFSPSRPSSTASHDDDRYSIDRRAASVASHFLRHTSVQHRWRLRWLHAARAEMQHTLACLNHYTHTTVIHAHTAAFMERLHTVSTVAALGRLHTAYVADMTAALHINSQSPLASLVEALIATAASFAAAVTALPPGVRAEGDGDGSADDNGVEQDEERVESWQAVRDLHRQFRAHALLMSRMLHVAVREDSNSLVVSGSGSLSGVSQLQCAFDFNGYYARRRQHELELQVLK